MIKVYMGLPSMGSVCDLQSYALRFIENKYADKVQLVYPEALVQRMFHDAARNGIVDDFLASDCDVLWFLDSDIVPPPTILDLIVQEEHPWEAAGAPYPIFMGVPGEEGKQVVFTAYKGTNGKGLTPGPIPQSGREFVDGLATGCLFLKRSVFADMSKPYFEHKYDAESRMIVEGEDLGFCLKLNAKGKQFLTDYSMVCKHYKSVDLLDLNNYAMDYARKAVQAYDAQIKDQVAAAIKAAYRRGRDEGAPKSSLILPSHLK